MVATLAWAGQHWSCAVVESHSGALVGSTVGHHLVGKRSQESGDFLFGFSPGSLAASHSPKTGIWLSGNSVEFKCEYVCQCLFVFVCFSYNQPGASLRVEPTSHPEAAGTGPRLPGTIDRWWTDGLELGVVGLRDGHCVFRKCCKTSEHRSRSEIFLIFNLSHLFYQQWHVHNLFQR